jgi:hemoglobin
MSVQAPPPAGQPSEPSFYSQLGGAPVVAEAVDRFYRRVLDDEQLRPYFDGVDVARLKRHQAALLTNVLGGPDAYGGRDLATAHSQMGITEADYQRVGDHLVAVLEEMNAGPAVIEHVAQTLVAVSEQVIAHP